MPGATRSPTPQRHPAIKLWEMNTTSQQAPCRPTEKTTELLDQILWGLSRGRSLYTICAPSSMPLWSYVLRWIADDELLERSVELASEIGRGYLADRIVDIADEPASSLNDPDGVPCDTAIRWAKLRVDARLKVLSKWKPKTYKEMAEILRPSDGRQPAIRPPEHRPPGREASSEEGRSSPPEYSDAQECNNSNDSEDFSAQSKAPSGASISSPNRSFNSHDPYNPFGPPSSSGKSSEPPPGEGRTALEMLDSMLSNAPPDI